MKKHLLRLVQDERIRFLVVGGINTVLGYAIYSALVLWVFGSAPLGYVISLVVSYAIAITVAFVLYRRFVFRVSGHVFRDYFRFVGVYLVSIAINTAVLPLLVEFVGLSPLIAQAIVLIVTTLISFFGHKSFSFRRAPGSQASGSADVSS